MQLYPGWRKHSPMVFGATVPLATCTTTPFEDGEEDQVELLCYWCCGFFNKLQCKCRWPWSGFCILRFSSLVFFSITIYQQALQLWPATVLHNTVTCQQAVTKNIRRCLCLSSLTIASMASLLLLEWWLRLGRVGEHLPTILWELPTRTGEICSPPAHCPAWRRTAPAALTGWNSAGPGWACWTLGAVWATQVPSPPGVYPLFPSPPRTPVTVGTSVCTPPLQTVK